MQRYLREVGKALVCAKKRNRTLEGAEKVTKDTMHPGQKKEHAERNAAALEKMLKIKEENDRDEERSRQLSDKVESYRACRQEKKEEGSNASQTGDCCLEAAMRQQFIALNRIEGLCPKVPERNGSGTGADARKRRRKKEQGVGVVRHQGRTEGTSE